MAAKEMKHAEKIFWSMIGATALFILIGLAVDLYDKKYSTDKVIKVK